MCVRRRGIKSVFLCVRKSERVFLCVRDKECNERQRVFLCVRKRQKALVWYNHTLKARVPHVYATKLALKGILVS